MSKWGEFQSVIQLSAALNIVVFTLSQVIGREIDIERTLIDELELDSHKIYNNDQKKALDSRIKKLQNEFETWAQSHDKTFSCVTYFSLVAFLFGIVLLFVSSFNYDDCIGKFAIGFTVILNAPPVISSIYAIFNFHKFSAFKEERRKIFQDADTQAGMEASNRFHTSEVDG